MNDHDPIYLNRLEASAFLRNLGFPVSPAQLEKLASIGGGPPYLRFRKFVLYRKAELTRWAESCLGPCLTSTSDARCPARPGIRLPKRQDGNQT